MTVNRVIFIRPGETSWNRIGRWQGGVAVPLSPHGREQAKRLSQFVRIIGLSAIYSSDLRRAKETAEIIADAADIEVIYDKRLRERSMGNWQGLTMQEIRDWYPDEYERLQQAPDTFQIPSGESRQQVANRVLAAFQDIEARGGETVGILSHATAMRAVLAYLVPASDPHSIHFRNMSVTTIVRHEDTWNITQLDDVTHLEGMEAASISELEERHDT